MSKADIRKEINANSDDDDIGTFGAGARASAINPRTDPGADKMVAEAEKALKKFSLFSGDEKYDTARTAFRSAAARYKINKNWEQAGDAFVKAADISLKKLKEEHEAVTDYTNAAKAYKNSNTRKAMTYFQQAGGMLMEANRLSSAAKLWRDVAEMFEKDMQLERAQEAYEKAVTCYDAEDSKSNANGCRVKIAQLAAELEDYKHAVEVYECVAKDAIQTNVGRWSVSGYLFKALLCYFAIQAQKGNADKVLNKLESYKDMHPQFEGTREEKLIQGTAEAFNEGDVDKFTEEVMRFDEIIKLDNWTAKILLDIKKVLEEGGSTADVNLA